MLSLEVLHAARKDRLVLFAVDISADERAVTLGVAHLAEHAGLVMPSIAHSEPFGFQAMSMEGSPVRSVYWNAICPFCARLSITCCGATKRPSPCDTAIECRSPTAQADSHGLLTEATRVVT